MKSSCFANRLVAGTFARRRRGLLAALACLAIAILTAGAIADEPASEPKSSPKSEPATSPPTPSPAEAKPADGKDPPGLKRLDPNYEVWIDAKRKRVVVKGEIVLRQGPLELFACPVRTKEHESIIALNTKAYLVHAALLAVGAEPGNPAQFVPQYVPATGSEVAVTVFWTDADGKRQRARAQDWMKNTQTGETLKHSWVFGGSGFWHDDATGQDHYQAESGDLICISNFSSATLDLPIESSQVNDQLLFEAFTQRIPPVKTPVTVVLTPKPAAKGKGAKNAVKGKPKGGTP